MACLARSTRIGSFSAKGSALNKSSTRYAPATTTRSALPPAFVEFAPVIVAKDALVEQVALVENTRTPSADVFSSFVRSAPLLDAGEQLGNIREELNTTRADIINTKKEGIKDKAEAQLEERQGKAGVFSVFKGNPLKAVDSKK